MISVGDRDRHNKSDVVGYVSRPFAQGVLNTVSVIYRGEYYMPRKTFEEYRETLLAITAQHEVTIRIVDDE